MQYIFEIFLLKTSDDELQHQFESSTCRLQSNPRVQFLIQIITPRDYKFSVLLWLMYGSFGYSQIQYYFKVRMLYCKFPLTFHCNYTKPTKTAI